MHHLFRTPSLLVVPLALGCHWQSTRTTTQDAQTVAPTVTSASAPVARPDYWPTDGWKEGTPESQGVSSTLLAQAVTQASERGIAIHDLLVIRHGVVVLDARFYPFAGGRHDIASITKSVTSMLVGAAIERGLLPSADVPLFDVLPNRPARANAQKQKITLANLLGMQSGLACGLDDGERELHVMLRSADWIQNVLDLPMRTSPGTTFDYCSGNYHLLSAVITARTHLSELDFARQTLLDPLGITDVEWPVDPAGLTHGWGDLQLLPRDLAKLGFLMLHGGEWNGRQLLSRAWINWSTAGHSKYGDNFYGFGWWSHQPAGFFEGVGRGGQRLSVWPEKDVIVVMNGGGFRPDDVSGLLLQSLVADTALAPNPDGVAELRRAMTRATQPPVAHTAQLPSCHAAISGITYTTGSNALDLRSFSLSFAGTDSAIVRLAVQKYDLVLPAGLDGVYRTSKTLIDGIAPMARLTWKEPCEFVLDFNLVGKIDRYTMNMTFDQRDPRRATVSIAEATSTRREVTSATAQRHP